MDGIFTPFNNKIRRERKVLENDNQSQEGSEHKGENDGKCPISAQGGLSQSPVLGGSSIGPGTELICFPKNLNGFIHRNLSLGKYLFLLHFITASSNCGPGQSGHPISEAQKTSKLIQQWYSIN